QSLPAQTRVHETGRRRTEDDFAMCAQVVAVRMADKNLVRTGLRFASIQPQTQWSQPHASEVKFDSPSRHKSTLDQPGGSFQAMPLARTEFNCPLNTLKDAKKVLFQL